MRDVGLIDPYANRHAFLKHQITPIEALEACWAACERDAWRWDQSEEHGLRVVGTGFTKRGKNLFVVIVPRDPLFDRHTATEQQWEDCGEWVVVTAYKI